MTGLHTWDNFECFWKQIHFRIQQNRGRELYSWDIVEIASTEQLEPWLLPKMWKNGMERITEDKPGETINDYLTNLRDIAAGCEFENVEITLGDRIVVGMRDLRLQRKLITKKSISLKEVMEEARAAEISEKPAAKIEKFESVHSAWGTTSKYQGEGEIGELSQEEEEEIHR
ncbi:hypothetical protein E2320_001788, partial [Naja naja]